MDIWAWEKYYKAAQAETLQVINKIKKTVSPSSKLLTLHVLGNNNEAENN